MPNARYRVYICVGPNCGPKGSPRLAGILASELAGLGLEEDVTITMGGCQSHCETGPTMVVFPGPVFYEHVDRERLHRIAREHLADDRPVVDYFWDRTRPPRKIIPGREFSKGYDPSTMGKNQPIEKPKKQKPKKTYEVDDFKW